MFAVALLLRQYMWWENRQRNKQIGEGVRTEEGADAKGILGGFTDRTDKSNLHFRYPL
jgi:hypothetical protein